MPSPDKKHCEAVKIGSGHWLPPGTRVRVSAGTELIKVSNGMWVAYSEGPPNSPLDRKRPTSS